jgi:hypothetical protein
MEILQLALQTNHLVNNHTVNNHWTEYYICQAVMAQGTRQIICPPPTHGVVQ